MRKSVFFIFIFAYILRVLFLPQLALTFGYDQARDALVSQQILQGDVKILGPPASTPGLYHGVFYYYLLAPAYLVGKGSPIVAAYWVALLNAASVFIIFYLTYLLTKRVGAALFTSFLFAISFEATQYATWLSNPTIGVWTVPLMYLGLWAWTMEKRKWGAPLAAIGLGLSIQAELFLLYHAVPLLIWLWMARKKILRTHFFHFSAFFLLSISTMIIAELKFGFRSLSGVTQLLATQEPIASARSLGDFLILYFNQLGRVFAFNSYPGNIGYAGTFILVLIVAAIWSWNKGNLSWKPFLALWIFSHITVVSVGGTYTPFLLVGIGPAVSILLGIYLYGWWKKRQKVLASFLLVVLIFGNLSMIFRENPRGQTIFAIQKDMILKKQFPAIDYTYQEASGEPFSINSLTSPLWINIVWTYLYKWYGRSEYGYIPEWHGRDQVGQLDTLPQVDPETKQYFLILEPPAGIPERFVPLTIGEEDAKSELVEEKTFGEIVVQKRLRKE